jgi:hypothetical protein
VRGVAEKSQCNVDRMQLESVKWLISQQNLFCGNYPNPTRTFFHAPRRGTMYEVSFLAVFLSALLDEVRCTRYGAVCCRGMGLVPRVRATLAPLSKLIFDD